MDDTITIRNGTFEAVIVLERLPDMTLANIRKLFKLALTDYIEGAPRAYSKDLLKEYAKEKYTYNGQTMNEYDAIQQQRHIERKLREWKREAAVMKAAGMDASEATGKVTEWNKRQADFIDQTGLKRQRERERIAQP